MLHKNCKKQNPARNIQITRKYLKKREAIDHPIQQSDRVLRDESCKIQPEIPTDSRATAVPQMSTKKENRKDHVLRAWVS